MLTKKKFTELVRMYGGEFQLDDDGSWRGWWDAYGDLTNLYILYGRLLELTKGERNIDLMIYENHLVYHHPRRLFGRKTVDRAKDLHLPWGLD